MKHRSRRASLALLLLAIPLLVGCRSITGATGWAPPLAHPTDPDAVIVRNDDERLSVIDIASAQELWRFPDEDNRFPGLIDEIDAKAFYGPPLLLPGGDEFLVGGQEDGIVYAVRSDGTSARLIFDTDDRIIAGLVADGTVVYVATTNKHVFAVDANLPETAIWRYDDLGGEIWGTPALAQTETHGALLIVPAMNGDVYALRTDPQPIGDDQRLVWKVETGASVASSVVVVDGLAFFGSFDKTLYAVNVETGDPVWTTDGNDWFWGSIAAVDDVIYVADLSGRVQALDRTDGSTLWVTPYEAEDEVRARPLLVDPELLLIVDRGGLVHALNPRTGQRLWLSPTPIDDDVLADPVVVAGRVLVSNDDGDLFEVLVDDQQVQPLFPRPTRAPGTAG